MTPIGSDSQIMFELAVNWLAGGIPDLGAALKRLDRAIDEKIRAALAELDESLAA